VIALDKDDKVRSIINVKNLADADYVNNHYLVMCTTKGIIKKTTLEAFSRPRTAGIFAINIREGDRLLEVRLTNGNEEVMIAKKSGKAVRFNEAGVRPMGRVAAGVKAIALETEDDEVVGMVCVKDASQDLLVLSEKGYGKRSSVEDYRITNRGAKGVRTLNITEKTGNLVAILDVNDSNELMIINKSGISIRLGVAELRVMGRNTQGVRLIRLNDGDEIMSIAKIDIDPEAIAAEAAAAAAEAANVEGQTDNDSTGDANEDIGTDLPIPPPSDN
jgi:DNA gyrase subunit A